MNVIRINGKTITASGNITIANGKVLVDGKDYTPNEKEISIEITGNVNTVKVDVCDTLTINGDVSSVATQSGDVECKNVTGSIQTMSGDVNCENVGGSVSTMSENIRYKR